MFVDEAEIFVEAGRGGKGARSFHHARSRRKRHPNGGDGGRGGHVIIQTDHNIHTLLQFRHKKNIKARPGGNGGSNRKKGKDGKDEILRVPLGTLIYSKDNNLLLRDLKEPNDQVIIVKGGRGGLGNAKLKLKEVRPPEEGQSLHLYLELKLIAEVGLVGYPNAGKSSLVNAISKAKPKIAAYPFTTKAPVLGLVEDGDRIFKIADIPGLIKGAHSGSGLGDRFLRHIERTKILIFIIDMAGVDQRHPWDDYRSLREELELYSLKLKHKPYLVAANKMDLDEAKKNIVLFRKKTKEEPIEISCLEKTGLEELIKKTCEILL
jgi:GTPase